jgi:hypothetical protein
MMTDGPRYRLELPALPCGAPPARRLARLLKCCLWYGFKCVDVREVPGDGSAGLDTLGAGLWLRRFDPAVGATCPRRTRQR